ncbi:hypothetical protein FSP39_014766 [Pinctada imbricata]|uniref:SAM-dependent MTase TRM10-type domain-containing protein n=1 Tax=Pinctada imbricata TaxID=66713 RepID=A0AA89BNM0_PINIB|nr:hypothetical protein FSP39_014766 [Pinctada imbricata]
MSDCDVRFSYQSDEACGGIQESHKYSDICKKCHENQHIPSVEAEPTCHRSQRLSEKSKLAQQLCRLYGVNRKSVAPAHLYFVGFDKEGELYKECIRKNSGFHDYKVEITDQSVTELFPLDEIVYLTPDSDTELSEIDDSKVYVLGGLVDESISTNTTKEKAESVYISTAKLPISQYMERVEQASYSQVLAINQVFEILMTFKSTGDWRTALATGVPKRKGYKIPHSSGK